ncbi:MAG: hypothetical protein QM811_20600 [Pirellulales bacterium]
MWRSAFLALGIFTLVLGIECLIMERATIISQRDTASAKYSEFVPPDYAPWSLMSAGTIVILYSFTLPKRFKSEG